MTLADLPRAWRSRADQLADYAPPAAKAFAEAAEELERALEQAGAESLTLTEAERESGYRADTLARKLRSGEIPNAGRKHAPRIRRSDLPKKPGHTQPTGRAARGNSSLEAIRREAIRSRTPRRG